MVVVDETVVVEVVDEVVDIVEDVVVVDDVVDFVDVVEVVDIVDVVVDVEELVVVLEVVEVEELLWQLIVKANRVSKVIVNVRIVITRFRGLLIYPPAFLEPFQESYQLFSII